MNTFQTAIQSVSDVVAVRRERMRGVIAVAVVGLMIIYSVLMIIFVWNRGSADVDTLITGIFTPIIGIVGTVVGFYFGAQSKDE